VLTSTLNHETAAAKVIEQKHAPDSVRGADSGSAAVKPAALMSIEAFDARTDDLNAIVETAKGSRNKFKYDEERQLFVLSGVLPAGAVFPFDFGFVPSTLGPDGDPLDVLLLMDEPAFPGCLVTARLLGVIEAEQTEEDGKTVRNDRLIAVASESKDLQDVRSLSDLNPHLVDEIEHFFISYNDIKGKKFKPVGRHGPQQARKLVEEGVAKRGAGKSKAGAKTGSRKRTATKKA
jgi:inorganic pyrophosphatase